MKSSDSTDVDTENYISATQEFGTTVQETQSTAEEISNAISVINDSAQAQLKLASESLKKAEEVKKNAGPIIELSTNGQIQFDNLQSKIKRSVEGLNIVINGVRDGVSTNNRQKESILKMRQEIN